MMLLYNIDAPKYRYCFLFCLLLFLPFGEFEIVSYRSNVVKIFFCLIGNVRLMFDELKKGNNKRFAE